MFDANIDRIARKLVEQLLADNSQIAFKDLVQKPLPSWLWGYLNVFLNPQLGGQIQIGLMSFDFSRVNEDKEMLQKFKTALNEHYVLTGNDLKDITIRSLKSYIQFVIDPSSSIVGMIYERGNAESMPAGQVRAALEGLTKLFERWDPSIASAISVVKPYLAGLSSRPISALELTRVISSAIEKESAHDSLKTLQTSLNSLQEIINLDPDAQSAKQVDFTEPICQVLTNRGMTSWTPAIVVEREVAGGHLNVQTAVKAMRRLEIFREKKLLGAEPEDLTQVTDEIDSFTNFLDTVTE